MIFFRLLSASVVALGLATAVQAQSLKNARPPSNLPPGSFTGAQFVDNRGCVYIRAGRGGTVNWVPRVSRSRQQICGLQPTFGQTRTAAAPQRTTRVVRAAVPTVATAPRVVQPATTTRTVTIKRPKTTTRRVVRVKKQAAPVRANTRVVANAGSQRVGPQGVNQRIHEANTLRPPKGFKSAWSDDRLNPLRGVSTTSGKASMNLIWSQTVPRYLIDPKTGKRATRGQIRLFGG